MDGWPGTSVHGGWWRRRGDASVDTSVAALTVKAVLPHARERRREAESEGGREGKMRVG